MLQTTRAVCEPGKRKKQKLRSNAKPSRNLEKYSLFFQPPQKKSCPPELLFEIITQIPGILNFGRFRQTWTYKNTPKRF